MYSARPYGRFARGAELSGEDARAVERLARIVTNAKDASGLPSIKQVMTLPSGRQAVAVDMGGAFRIYIDNVDVFERRLDGIAQATVPLLYSGNIETAVVPVGEGVVLRPTDTTRRRLAGYPDDGGGVSGHTLRLQKFAVEYGIEVSELLPREPQIGRLYTQFDRLHSTWYTGAMAEVVQICKGFGIQDDDQLPENERAELRIPEPVRQKIVAEIGVNTRLPGYFGVPDLYGQIHYDYKWPNTDAVAFSGDGQPWLVKVSSGAAAPRGVWAMPLPTIPATSTAAFREWMEDVNDHEILAILDRFGAIPSGEGWPRDFHGWRRAGVIIKVCEVSDYFEHTPYSSPCGFAFNRRGTEAFATCWKFNDGEDGINEGLSYKLRLMLGSAADQGRLPFDLKFDDEGTRQRVDAYLSELYRRLKTEYENPEDSTTDLTPIYYKVRRHTAAEIAQLANGEVDLDYWINKEMPPIASHSGACSRVGRGYLVGFLPAIKFPESIYLEPACLTPDAFTTPASDGHGGVKKYPRCDTIMYGFYDADDSLTVVKYFREEPKSGLPAEDAPECPYAGPHEWRGAADGASIMGSFYTTNFDDRQVLYKGYTRYRTNGRYIGPSGWYGWQGSYFWTYFNANRMEYYDRERQETHFDYHVLGVAALIPYGFRAGYVYAKSRADKIAGGSDAHWWDSIQNRTVAHFWSFHGGAAWVGAPLTRPYPRPPPENFSFALADGRSVRPPEPCTMEADEDGWVPDEGEFAQGLQSGRVQLGPLSHGDPTSDGPKWRSTLSETQPRTENEVNEIHFAFSSRPSKVSDLYVPNYFQPSPDPDTSYPFWVYGAANCFGKAAYAYISEGNSHIGESKYISLVGSQKRIPRFIGVINE